MNVSDFMKANLSEIKNIILNLPAEFSSHDFIEKFSKKYESDYIDMLVDYKGREAFKTVHSQVAKFLSLNMKYLGINKRDKDSSEHVFGELDVIQWWKKI